MKKKRILIIFFGELYRFVPGLTVVESLQNSCELSVLSYEKEINGRNLRHKYAGVNVISQNKRPDYESFLDKVIRHVFYPIKFHLEVCRILKKSHYDLIWVLHEKTLKEFQNYLTGKKYVVSFYELNDHNFSFIRKTQKGVKNAMHVVSCEHNRSCIMRVWYQLPYTPSVIPNKPFSHPRERNLDCSFSHLLDNKEIILYQGYIQKVRNIDNLCKALLELPSYTLVLMGGGDESYIAELKNKYKNIIFIGFVAPPEHLKITSYARIGIVKYDHVYLNHTFCAPNKIWEYSGFGIPILGNDLPGLEYTIGQAGAGLCVNFDDIEDIKRGIIEINAHYESYSAKALSFYESVDIKDELLNIVNKSI